MPAAVEAAMLDAHRAGLSVIPLGPNKRPTVRWGDYQDNQPDELDVVRWARTAEGFAMICGGPQRIQVLDFEAEFVATCWRQFVLGLDDDNLTAFTNWLAGYDVVTPTGGKHVAVHLIGDGPQPGNVKLAGDVDGHVLAETRGHGGYVAAAPSNGSTHPTGGQWVQNQGGFEQIAWATAEEWSAICAAISQFDAVAASETPPEPVHLPVPGGVSLSRIEHTGSWIEGVQLPSAEEILERAGWTYSHTDRAGRNYWSHPDKPPQEGHSATVWPNGRVKMFTNSTVIPQSPQHGNYDVVDLIGYLTIPGFNHQRTDDRMQVFRRYRELTEPRLPSPPAATVADGWLPEDFWTATPWLEDIRAAAWGNGKCPEALLGAVLSAYSVRIPSSIKVAPIIHGVASPLNLYVALCAMSGGGKSSTMTMAQQLCGVYDDELYRYCVNLRSGEGLVTAAIIPQNHKRGELPPEPRFRMGLQVEFDEGKTLAVQHERSGSTMVPYLATAWSGQQGKKVGGIKAAGEEAFPADMVRVSLVLGVQYGVAGTLFTGDVESLGFPGRFTYFGMDHPGPKLEAGHQSSVRPLNLPRYWPGDAARGIGEMTFPLPIQQEVIDWDYERYTSPRPAIDGHLMLLRARNVCVLALMDQQPQPSDLHWQLAGSVGEHSLWTRSRVLAGIHQVSAEHARSAGRMDMVRESARHDAWIEDRARRLAVYVHDASRQPVAWRRIKDRFNAADRKQLDAIVVHAIERNWVAYAASDTSKALEPGRSRPA